VNGDGGSVSGGSFGGGGGGGGGSDGDDRKMRMFYHMRMFSVCVCFVRYRMH
jgi:hypothetical protein